MSTSNLRLIVIVACAVLAGCTHFEQVRLRSQGPSPGADHCPACMDLGQAWALFRLGALDEVEAYCELVIEAEADPDGPHARRARDLVRLTRGFTALHAGDHPTARAQFREIRDPQLRALGSPYVDSAALARAGEGQEKSVELESLFGGGAFRPGGGWSESALRTP